MNVEKPSKDKDGVMYCEVEKDRARKKASREDQSQEEKDRMKERDKIRKRAARAAQSLEDKSRSRSKTKRARKLQKKPSLKRSGLESEK